MSNNIFNHQSYYEKTAAFAVDNLFFSITTGLIYIYTKHIHFLMKHLHTFTLSVLISNKFSKVYRKPTVPDTPEEHFFIEHLWMEAVRDVLTLILMTHFKEC